MATSPARRVRAYIGLGANVGDAVRTLAWAIGRLATLPGVRIRDVSRLYATAPWGVADQPEFRNAVLGLETGLPALDLLVALKTLEREAGRVAAPRWGPRVLDLDLLVYGRQRIAVERPPEARSLDAGSDPARAARLLEVPHRDLGDRLFVLAPLADIAPGLVPPGWRETIGTRHRAVAAAEPPDAVRVVGTWDPTTGRWR